VQEFKKGQIVEFIDSMLYKQKMNERKNAAFKGFGEEFDRDVWLDSKSLGMVLSEPFEHHVTAPSGRRAQTSPRTSIKILSSFDGKVRIKPVHGIFTIEFRENEQKIAVLLSEIEEKMKEIESLRS
jgi:hypothetical protein